MRIGSVAEIWRYPVKSMGGERVPAVDLTEGGVPGDRAWATRDREADETRSAKRIPRLLLCSARYLEEPTPGSSPPAEITLPDGGAIRTDAEDAAARLSAALEREVTLTPLMPDLVHYKRGKQNPHVDRMTDARMIMGLEGDEPFPEIRGIPASYADYATAPGTYFDLYPLHLLTTASLTAGQNANPAAQFDVRRFRPNFLIATEPGLDGYVEFDWEEREIRIGEARLRVVVSTVRCAMPAHAQRGLERDREVVKTLQKETGQYLGVYARALEPGRVAAGDPVELLNGE